MTARTQRQHQSLPAATRTGFAPHRHVRRITRACARRRAGGLAPAAPSPAGNGQHRRRHAPRRRARCRCTGRTAARWVVGTPGQEYGIRVCNRTGERVLAVMSVDGVNVVSGETASPSQSGYVLSALRVRRHQRLAQESSSTAAFYFHRAARCVRHAHGASRQRRRHRRRVLPRAAAAHQLEGIAAARPRRPRPAAGLRRAAGARQRRREGRANNDAMPRAARWRPTGQRRAAPVPLAKDRHRLRPPGTVVRADHALRARERDAEPDARDQLRPPRESHRDGHPAAARRSHGTVNPFPAWTPRFVPDPPTR